MSYRSITDQDAQAMVVSYHERTKHHPHAYAASLGYMDWSNQPDPFRRYENALLTYLDHPAASSRQRYDALFQDTPVHCAQPGPESLSELLYDSLALSAWKQARGTAAWSLRVNPSSGNLHPTECYVLCQACERISDSAGIYHYLPYLHALEQRSPLDPPSWQRLTGALPAGAVLVGLTSIYWRESWKYGERGFRYCQHDIGHALAALSLAAACQGWCSQLIDPVVHSELAALLTIADQQGIEAEHPECLLLVHPAANGTTSQPVRIDLSMVPGGVAAGTPNQLSRAHHDWPVIDEVATATQVSEPKGLPRKHRWSPPALNCCLPERPQFARQIIRQRRSALALDGTSAINCDTFYHMLARVMPCCTNPCLQAWPWKPEVTLALFVHRVRDLERGLYVLVRHPDHMDTLRHSLRDEFAWATPSACPAELPLYFLKSADCRQSARLICCHQDIGADGAFSLGMLARFDAALQTHGAWFYRRLFWETGIIGQILYLEAEAAGIRATGIGCFFDDVMHHTLGIHDRTWQSLYHFTVGAPIEDPRLQTRPAYAHLKSKTHIGNVRQG